ncbi:S1C family serine protease [Polynucleobacter sp.]|uniref:S1C family serine protease n=1 Tax=Polynucleobacter sp. TaxID=2029855 RepID=UPI0027372EF7|nr:Do family serine endopeptidase [Polynucleobacter sp.]MDP3122885.1 Do family serine endopeptidase [Polynucleobacter sp.]
MNRLWLLFCQAITILLAAWFVLTTLKPEWVSSPQVSSLVGQVTLREAPDSISQNPGSLAEAAKISSPAVVNIFTSKANKPKPGKKAAPHQNEPWFRFFFGDQAPNDEPSSSLGSGVIVSPQGIILTNHHVIEGADEIEVAFADGRKRNAKLIGSDPETDIAVLKIDATDLPNPITLGKMESVHVGDVVLAIGNPFGVGQTVTSGIVSALGRNQLGINTFENFIQTDAAINPGNSGGALVDTKGNLIGINTAIYSRSGGNMGIGFAIPINTAKQVMESILTNGSVTRGWIGVEPQNLSKELAESLNLPKDTTGVLISGVLEGGPADKAGIKPGDVLTQVNSQTVNDVVTLLNRIAQTSPGDEAKVNLIRKGKEITLKVQVGKRPKSKAKS